MLKANFFELSDFSTLTKSLLRALKAMIVNERAKEAWKKVVEIKFCLNQQD